MTRLAPILACLAGLALATPAAAQSTAASQASAVSVAPSADAASRVLEALPAGSGLAIASVDVVGESVLVTVVSVADGASFVVELGAEAASRLALAAGAVVSVAVVSGGYLLAIAGEALAFVPDAATRALIHHRALD